MKTTYLKEITKSIKEIKPLLTLLAFVSFITLSGLASCSSDDDPIIDNPNNNNDTHLVSKVSIRSSYEVSIGGEITIDAEGFTQGDKVKLEAQSGDSKYTISLSNITNSNASFSIPENIKSGLYTISVIRGDKDQSLGTVRLNIVANTNIPDKEGMTIKGVVSSDGVGVPGVVVSDGYEVTVTDEEGVYYLPSEKKNGYVFISVPGNFEVSNKGKLPEFFQKVMVDSKTVEQRNFSLTKTDNKNHVVLAMADWHLAKRNNDLDQFNNFLNDANATIKEYKSKGLKVYGLTLGDMSWDLYWYSNNFALPEYVTQMNRLDATVFNVMGNHDNDPYEVGNWKSALAYKEHVAPNYYSFNLGDIHYVVLDDTEYLNTGGAPGIVGNRNYNDKLVDDQINWLKKDLATIKDKSTPIVVAMHIPLYNYPSLKADGTQNNSVRITNGDRLINLLSDFNDVRILSGHTHVNFTVEISPNFIEYNTGAVCATWWWTGRNGYAGNHICKDGSPGGYGVWEMNGKEMKSYYKSTGYEKDYQFRTYDRNEIEITPTKYAPKASPEHAAKLANFAKDFASKSSSNEVIINVWGYDDSWDIEVKEDGKNLDVTRYVGNDPLHIISYSAQRLNVSKDPTSSFTTNNTAHLFKVKASSPTSTLDIKVTDRHGRVYTEKMERPKEFKYDMR